MKISTKGPLCAAAAAGYRAAPAGRASSRSKEIAERQEVSKKYLEQIIPLLNRAEYPADLARLSGRLPAVPARRRIIPSMRSWPIAEGGLAPVACLDGTENLCPRKDSCLTLPVWEGLDRTIRDYLSSITLQDILDMNQNR